MTLGKRIVWRIEMCWDGICSFFKLIRRIPGFYRLNRIWDKEPREIWEIINNYVKVMYTLTDGHLSRPSYDADTVIEEATACMERDLRDEK